MWHLLSIKSQNKSTYLYIKYIMVLTISSKSSPMTPYFFYLLKVNTIGSYHSKLQEIVVTFTTRNSH